jgi:superfamily II RNA helicase
VFVEYTVHRPTPLEHSVYTKGYLVRIMDSTSNQTDFTEYERVIKLFQQQTPNRPRISKKQKQPSKIDLKR